MKIDLKTLSLFALTAAMPFGGQCADTLRLQSVWQEGDRDAVHTGLLSLEQFNRQGEELAAQGLRLIDVETEVINGRRGFAGLWTRGSGDNYFHVTKGLAAFRRNMQAMRSEGRRLVDFETYRDGGARYWAGVYRNGLGEERIVRPLTIDKFLEYKELMRSQGLQIRDVEAVSGQGEIRFAALYSTETPPVVFTGYRPRAQFTDLRDRMDNDGWALFDVERIRNAQGRDVYFGLWKEGTGSSALSRFRTAAKQLLFTARQHEAGKTPVDVEIKRFTQNMDEDPVDPPDRPVLPPNPSHVNVSSGSGTPRFEIEFTGPPDFPLRISYPRDWLPSHLPQQDGSILVPDGICGINIKHADHISWQIGEQVLNTAPFRSGDVTETVDLLGGISFSGPIGGCAGQDVPWIFQPPYTQGGETRIDPPNNLKLVVEGVGASLEFQHAGASVEEVVSADEFFAGDTLDQLQEVLDTFDEIAQAQGNIDDYCSTVGAYWTAVCIVSSGGECPLPRPRLPGCSLE